MQYVYNICIIYNINVGTFTKVNKLHDMAFVEFLKLFNNISNNMLYLSDIQLLELKGVRMTSFFYDTAGIFCTKPMSNSM